MKTHNKKNPPAELLPVVSDSVIFGPGNSTEVRAEVIAAVADLDDPALRRLAAKQLIPAPRRARYPLQATLRGIIADLRTRQAQRQFTLPVLDSLDACEGAGYFTKRFLQTLKAAGLPGFENTRVDLNRLIPALESWLTGTPESDKHELQLEGVAGWSDMGEKYKAKLAKLQYQEEQGQRISKDTAIEIVRVLQSIHFHGYDRMIEELPAALAGRDAATIREQFTRFLSQLREAEENEIARLEKQNHTATTKLAKA